jgi:hypothetical protein
MPRSGTVITPNPVTGVGRPAPSMGWGECERCNYTKEAPGWRVSTAEENGVHSRVRDPHRCDVSLHRATSARAATANLGQRNRNPNRHRDRSTACGLKRRYRIAR